MIRIGLPLPTMMRLRIRAQVATSEIKRKASRASAGRLRSALVERLFRRGLTQAAWIEFEDRYEKLIGLLCWTAQAGIADDSAACYASLRSWFMKNYGRYRPVMTPHLPHPLPAAAETPDAFESLFRPTDLDSLINSLDAIGLIEVTRRARSAARGATSA